MLFSCVIWKIPVSCINGYLKGERNVMMLNGIERKSRGFTLIELLVVVAIIALLLAILLPSLRMVKEVARRVVCSSKLKEFGAALRIYSQDYRDKVVPNSSSNGREFPEGITSSYTPWWAYVVGSDDVDPDFLKAVNHGKLYSLRYLEEPELFYCPTAFLTLENVAPKYKPDYYFRNIKKYMPPRKSGGWGGPVGDVRCRSGYMYWTWERTSFLELANKPMVIDSLHRIGHMKGSKPYALNAVFGDGHVRTTLLTSSPDLQIGIDASGWTTWGTSYNRTVKALKALRP